jgi:WD40 repeat protein
VWVAGAAVALPSGLPPDKIAVAVSPSGNTIVVAVGGSSGPSGLTLLRTGDTYEPATPIRFGGNVLLELALTDDSTLSAWVGSQDSGHVAHYDLATGRVVSEGRGGSSSARDYPGALSPDGRYVALPAGTAGSMPIFRTDHDYSAEDAQPDLIGYATGEVGASVALSPDARFSAYATAGVVYVAPTQRPGAHPFAITALRGMTEVSGLSLRFVGDRYLLSGDGNRLMLWDLRQDTALLTSRAATVPFVPHSGLAPKIIANGPGTAFVTTNWRAGFTVTTIATGATLSSSSTSAFLAWRDDSSLYYADTADASVHLYDVDARKTATQFGWRWPTLPSNTGQYDVTSARYVAETNQLLVAGARQIASLDAALGAVTITRQGLSFPSVSADGRYGFGVGASNVSTVVDLATGALTPMDVQVDPDTGAADQAGIFSGYEGNILVTLGGAERLRTFWSTDGKTRLGSGPSAYEPAPFISVLPDGTRYAEHRADHSVAVVNLASGAPIGSFAIAHEEGRLSYTFSADGTRLVIAVPQPTTTSDPDNRSGLVMTIDLRPDFWVRVACASAGRDLTGDEWQAMTGQPPRASLRCE